MKWQTLIVASILLAAFAVNAHAEQTQNDEDVIEWLEVADSKEPAPEAPAAPRMAPILVGNNGEVHFSKRKAPVGKRSIALYKDGSPRYHALEWNAAAGEDPLKKLKSELRHTMGTRSWDTIRFMNGTIVTSSEAILSNDDFIVSAGHHFFYAPRGRKQETEVQLDRPVKLTTLELKPKVFHVDNLVSKEEAEYMYFMTKTQTLPMTLISERRQQAVFKDGLPYRFGDAIFDRVLSRVANFSLAHGHMMEPEIWMYRDSATSGPKFAWEQDYKPFGHRDAKRVATLHIFLNELEPENGGDIVFPHTMSDFYLTEKNSDPYLEDICRGAILKPVRFNDFSKRGNGLLIYTMLENERLNDDGEPDSRSEYLHCPVRGADKWVLSFSWYHMPVKMYDPKTTPLHRAFTEYAPSQHRLTEEFFHHLHPDDMIHVVDPNGLNGWNEGIIKGVRKFYPGNHALPLFKPEEAENLNQIFKRIGEEPTVPEIRDPQQFQNAEELARAAHLKEVEKFFSNAKNAEDEAEKRHLAEVAEQKDEL